VAASRVLSRLAKGLICHPVALQRFATKGKCSCFKFVGFDIGRVCKGPLLDDNAGGQIYGGGWSQWSTELAVCGMTLTATLPVTQIWPLGN